MEGYLTNQGKKFGDKNEKNSLRKGFDSNHLRTSSPIRLANLKNPNSSCLSIGDSHKRSCYFVTQRNHSEFIALHGKYHEIQGSDSLLLLLQDHFENILVYKLYNIIYESMKSRISITSI